MQHGLAKVDFVNRVLSITPRRSELDRAVARLAASIMVSHLHKGATVDIGTGMLFLLLLLLLLSCLTTQLFIFLSLLFELCAGHPEVMAVELLHAGVVDELVLICESGVFGGMPLPGAFFGASVLPTEI